MSWKHKNLRHVKDAAADHGFGEIQEARFPTEELQAENTGLGYLILRPDKRQPFAHRHKAAEEIYVVLAGSGRLKLDDELLDVGTMDAVRVAPQVARSFEAGPEGLEILVFGPRHAGDAEIVQDFW